MRSRERERGKATLDINVKSIPILIRSDSTLDASHQLSAILGSHKVRGPSPNSHHQRRDRGESTFYTTIGEGKDRRKAPFFQLLYLSPSPSRLQI
jgi:hypothetical protein